jgi:LCP family protein required for cell wall assembly
MVEAPDPGRGKHKRQRRRRGLLPRTPQDPEAGLAELRAARTTLADGGEEPGEKRLRAPWRRGRVRKRRPPWLRVLRWLGALVGAWIAVSIVVFVISSFVATGLPGSAVAALDSGGVPPFSATTILVLGTDGRAPGLKEPGASQDSESGGPVRSDTMMLIRTGGGRSARMSIPRDTVVDLPGYGLQKINAAYFYGGPAFAIREVESFLGIKINHVIVINFTNFEALVNAMGGVNFTGGCVLSNVDGGAGVGGWTLRLSAGTHHLDGLQALLLAQTRENLCNVGWDDLTREMNQQALLEGMKGQVLSPTGFIRLPWISWYAPQTLETDMSAPTLGAVATSLTLFGAGQTEVLCPTGSEELPGGGDGLTITQSAIDADVARFLGRGSGPAPDC